MLNNEEIVSAFVLSNTNSGETAVEWNDKHAKAVYIDRLGVNVKYSRQGIASLMLDKAKEITKTLDAKYLRLFVVGINIPAIQLYTKKEFVKVNGVYNEIFDDGFVLHEYGYEIKL